MPELKTANLRYLFLNLFSKPECILGLQANNIMKTILFAITLLGAFTVSATTVTYNFSTPANQSLGASSQSFASTPTGYSITAYGFENGSANSLYIKNEGTSESGLGLASQNDFEIDTHGLVVIDISNLDSASLLQLEVASVDRGESFAVYGLTSSAFSGGSTAPKLPGSALVTGGSSLDDTYFSVPDFSGYKYLALTATDGNVLLQGLSANVTGSIGNVAGTPEPATMGIVGLALVGVALAGRLRKKTAKSVPLSPAGVLETVSTGRMRGFAASRLA